MCFCVRVIPGDRVTPPTLTPPPLDLVTVDDDWAELDAVVCVRVGTLKLARGGKRERGFALQKRGRKLHQNRN